VWLSLVEHLVRDEGVAGSNPATPTNSTNKALISRIYLKPQINYDYAEYTSRDTSERFGWSASSKTATGLGARASGFPTTYAALYGPRLEAKFYAAVGTKPALAKQEFNEWLAETEGRISAIRGNRNGDGIALTPRQARALAGEWYHWFIVRHPLVMLLKISIAHFMEMLSPASADGSTSKRRTKQTHRLGEFGRFDHW
jgi:hypothetical protein